MPFQTWFGEHKKDSKLRKRIDYDVKRAVQQKLNSTTTDPWIAKVLAEEYLEHAPDMRFFAIAIASIVSPMQFILRRNKHIDALNPTELETDNLKKALHHLWVAGRYLGAIYDSGDREYHEKLNQQTLEQEKEPISGRRYDGISEKEET